MLVIEIIALLMEDDHEQEHEHEVADAGAIRIRTGNRGIIA
jgi:hypothetical protein